MNARGFHVYAALEETFGLEDIREALPTGTPVRTVSLSEAGLPGSEIPPGADLVVVGCSESHDQALAVISAAAAQRADRPVVVLYQGTANGFLERAFEAGADDLIALPQSAGQLEFALEKAVARRRNAGSGADRGSNDRGARAQGRYRQDGHVFQPGGRAGARGQIGGARRPRPAVRRRWPRARRCKPTRTIYDLAVSGGSLDADKIDGFLAQHPSGARALLAPLRPDQAATIGTAFLREVFQILRSQYDFLIVDTPPAFTPEVIAAVDASSHLCVVGMLDALSLKDTEDRARDAGSNGLRPDGGHARAQPRRLGRGHHAG